MKRQETNVKKQAPKLPLQHLERILPWILVICGIIGTLASLAITAEKFDLLQNPGTRFICDLNPVISCGSVMQSNQAAAFGFINTYIGIVGFPILITIGMALFAGARFKRWFWQGTQIGLTLGVIFAYWLLWQSIYRIGALCPYCLSVDVVLTVTFWYITLYNLREGHLRLRASGWQKLTAFTSRHHLDLLILWFAFIVVIILNHFWYYYGRHF